MQRRWGRRRLDIQAKRCPNYRESRLSSLSKEGFPNTMPNLLALTTEFTIRVTQVLSALEPGEVHRATQTTRIPGGPAVGIAQAARNLGHHAEIGGIVGKVNGRFVQRKLEQQGWTGHYLWCDGENPSTLLIAEAGGRSTVISEQHMIVGPEQVTELAALVASLRGQFDWVSLSGILPPGAPAASYAAICEAVRAAKLALDVQGSALNDLAHQSADVLCLNLPDAAGILGRTISSVADAHAACLELQQWGNRIVVINVDEQSTIGCDAGQGWSMTKNLDTALERDVMFGTLLAALMHGQPLLSALHQGVAAGCAPGETFETLLPYISIQALP